MSQAFMDNKKSPEQIMFQEYGTKIYHQIIVIFRSLSFLEFSNKTMQNYIDDLKTAINGFLQECDAECNFRFIEELPFIGEDIIKLDIQAYKKGEASKKVFDKLGIGEIRFTGHLNEKDLVDFLQVLTLSIKDDDNGKRVHEAEFNNIKVKKKYRVSFGDDTDEEIDFFQIYALYLLLIKDFINKNKEGGAAPPKHLKRLIQQIVDVSEGEDNKWIGITFLPEYRKELFAQIANTSILSMLLARKLKLSNYDLSEIALAALYFDIGKVLLPEEILAKGRNLSIAEWLEVRKVPIYSLKTLIKFKSFNESWITRFITAFESQMNVKGETDEKLISYPFKAKPILFSRIIAVVAAFIELTTPLGDEPGLLPDEAIRVLMEAMGKKYDTIIVRVFINMVGVYPIGTTVELDTREKGIVFDIPKGLKDYTRPIIKLVLDAMGKSLGGIIVDLNDQANGKFKRTIVNTIDPDELNVNVPHFFLS
ncbi:MAG: HD domain-containing phosphohydrolase [Pseudomonadota bacterium]